MCLCFVILGKVIVVFVCVNTTIINRRCLCVQLEQQSQLCVNYNELQLCVLSCDDNSVSTAKRVAVVCVCVFVPTAIEVTVVCESKAKIAFVYVSHTDRNRLCVCVQLQKYYNCVFVNYK